jgi:hypothetical protein
MSSARVYACRAHWHSGRQASGQTGDCFSSFSKPRLSEISLADSGSRTDPDSALPNFTSGLSGAALAPSGRSADFRNSCRSGSRAGEFGIPDLGLRPRLSSSGFRLRAFRGAAVSVELMQPVRSSLGLRLRTPGMPLVATATAALLLAPLPFLANFRKPRILALMCRRAIDLPWSPLPCPTASLLMLAAGDRHALSFSASSSSLENTEVVVPCRICKRAVGLLWLQFV